MSAYKTLPDVSAVPSVEGHTARPVRPFLRWAGGKTRLMPAILPHVPSSFARYHEPFLGAGSVFFAVQDRIHGTAFLSDLNSELINAWVTVRDAPDGFLRAINRYNGRDGEAHYYMVRSQSLRAPISRAARFFYLNQTSWNSLWRVNQWGEFNVPWGARSFRGIDPESLYDVSRTLSDSVIDELDFREALQRPRRGDFVYLDPPYLPISDTSKFSGYTERRFRFTCLADLAGLCEKLSARGVHWILSNRDTPSVRELFGFARIVAFTTRRSVAAQNRRDVEPIASPEVIVIGNTR